MDTSYLLCAHCILESDAPDKADTLVNGTALCAAHARAVSHRMHSAGEDQDRRVGENRERAETIRPAPPLG